MPRPLGADAPWRPPSGEFVSGMRAQSVMRHQLPGDLFGECGIEPAGDVDGRQFLLRARWVCLRFRAFQLEVCFLGVCLGVHGHVFTCCHRHRPGDHAGDARDHYAAVSPTRRRDTEHQTGRRKDPVVRAQDRRAQPADASGTGVVP